MSSNVDSEVQEEKFVKAENMSFTKVMAHGTCPETGACLIWRAEINEALTIATFKELWQIREPKFPFLPVRVFFSDGTIPAEHTQLAEHIAHVRDDVLHVYVRYVQLTDEQEVDYFKSGRGSLQLVPFEYDSDKNCLFEQVVVFAPGVMVAFIDSRPHTPTILRSQSRISAELRHEGDVTPQYLKELEERRRAYWNVRSQYSPLEEDGDDGAGPSTSGAEAPLEEDSDDGDDGAGPSTSGAHLPTSPPPRSPTPPTPTPQEAVPIPPVLRTVPPKAFRHPTSNTRPVEKAFLPMPKMNRRYTVQTPGDRGPNSAAMHSARNPVGEQRPTTSNPPPPVPGQSAPRHPPTILPPRLREQTVHRVPVALQAFDESLATNTHFMTPPPPFAIPTAPPTLKTPREPKKPRAPKKRHVKELGEPADLEIGSDGFPGYWRYAHTPLEEDETLEKWVSPRRATRKRRTSESTPTSDKRPAVGIEEVTVTPVTRAEEQVVTDQSEQHPTPQVTSSAKRRPGRPPRRPVLKPATTVLPPDAVPEPSPYLTPMQVFDAVRLHAGNAPEHWEHTVASRYRELGEQYIRAVVDGRKLDFNDRRRFASPADMFADHVHELAGNYLGYDMAFYQQDLECKKHWKAVVNTNLFHRCFHSNSELVAWARKFQLRDPTILLQMSLRQLFQWIDFLDDPMLRAILEQKIIKQLVLLVDFREPDLIDERLPEFFGDDQSLVLAELRERKMRRLSALPIRKSLFVQCAHGAAREWGVTWSENLICSTKRYTARSVTYFTTLKQVLAEYRENARVLGIEPAKFLEPHYEPEPIHGERIPFHAYLRALGRKKIADVGLEIPRIGGVAQAKLYGMFRDGELLIGEHTSQLVAAVFNRREVDGVWVPRN